MEENLEAGGERDKSYDIANIAAIVAKETSQF